ncbi:MAG: prolipoprotein diacylglyceryl transferase [Firmicutes bacterium]|mgnify:CR=1 FL=1|nr:prolipoprotein diacylglyceryl transferase [Bacillota bacterium]
MRPILWEIGPVRIHAYGFFLALAFLVATRLTTRLGKEQGISSDFVMDLALVACITSLIGARIGFVLLELPYYRAHPQEIIRFSEGGLSFHGGLILGVVVGIWFCRRRGANPWQVADLVAPAVALGTGIARIGCLLNGCCYGYPTNSPFGMAVALGDPTLRHPTQIYEAVLDVLLFTYLYRRRRHDRFPGYLGLVYLILYSVLRSFVEIYRESTALFGPIKIAQAFSFLVIFGAGISIYVIDRHHSAKQEELMSSAASGEAKQG